MHPSWAGIKTNLYEGINVRHCPWCLPCMVNVWKEPVPHCTSLAAALPTPNNHNPAITCHSVPWVLEDQWHYVSDSQSSQETADSQITTWSSVWSNTGNPQHTVCLELFSVCSQLSKCFLCVCWKWLPISRKSSYLCPKLFLSLSTPREHWLSTGHLAFPEVFSQLWEHWAWRDRICGSGSSLAPANPPVSLQPKIQVLKLVSALEHCFPSLCHQLWKFSHASSFLSECTSWIIAFHFRTSRTLLLDNQMYKFWSSFQWPHLSSSDISV